MTPVLHRLDKPKQTLRGITVASVDREFARITASGVVVEDVTAIGGGANVRPDFPAGIKGQGDATDVIVRRSKMSNFAYAPVVGKYRNGDGHSNELGNARWTWIGCTGNNNGDAGFDLKGPDNVVDKCDAAGNAHNLRLWSSCWIKSFWSRAPVLVPGTPGDPIHVHICPAVEHTEQQVFRFDRFFARDRGVLFFVETKPGAIAPKIVFDKLDVAGVTQVLRVFGDPPEIDWGPQGKPNV